MANPSEDDKRRDEVLRRMLNTPPKPHKKPKSRNGEKNGEAETPPSPQPK